MLAAQFAAALGGLGVLVLAPPARGFQLLVPFGASARARMLPLALEHGALLVGRGPLPGSIVVRGTHAALGHPLAAAGILMLAAPAAACGTTGDADADR